jgi:hypothetical protein
MFVEVTKEFLGRRPGERIDVAEADARQLLAAGTARPVGDDLITPLVNKALESAVGGLTRSLDAAIQTALKQVADAQSQARRHAVPALFGDGGGDPRRCFGDFCLAVARDDRNYLEKHYGSRFNEWKAKAALAEASGVTGGYTVPPEFYQQLMSLVAENAFIRPRAFVVPMAGASLQIPYLDITTVQAAGVSPFFGGVQMYWTAEAQTRTETEPQFKQMELKAWELSGYSVSSNVLLQDSVIGLERFLMNLFAMAIAWFEEYAFLQGDREAGSATVRNRTRLYGVPGCGQTAKSASVCGCAGLYVMLAPDWLPGGAVAPGIRPRRRPPSSHRLPPRAFALALKGRVLSRLALGIRRLSASSARTAGAATVGLEQRPLLASIQSRPRGEKGQLVSASGGRRPAFAERR